MIQLDEHNLTLPTGWKLQIVEQTDSTNDHLFLLAQQGAPQGTALLALRQSAGKGRHHRSFFSPQGGIYLSLLLKNQPTHLLSTLTPMAAVAVYRALRPHTHQPLSIKWVNDLLLSGKKVCGILTESRFVGKESCTVVGIGINFIHPQGDFPTDFATPATALTDTPHPHQAEQIVQDLIRHFAQLIQEQTFLEEYKSHCCTLGKQISLYDGVQTVTGKAVDILPDGALLLRLPDGQEKAFHSGEVTSQIQE